MTSVYLTAVRSSSLGFRHHGDISRAVSRAEALALGEILHQAALGISAHAVLELTGGFRRYDRSWFSGSRLGDQAPSPGSDVLTARTISLDLISYFVI